MKKWLAKMVGHKDTLPANKNQKDNDIERIDNVVVERLPASAGKNLPLKRKFSDTDYLCLYENSKL